MSKRQSDTVPFEIDTLVMASSALLGVLIMAFGFYHYDSMIIYLGVLVTGAASWSTLVFTMCKIKP